MHYLIGLEIVDVRQYLTEAETKRQTEVALCPFCGLYLNILL